MTSFPDKPDTAIREDLPFEQYLKLPGVSQSMLKTFDYDSGGCPALFRYAIENGGLNVESKALDDGRRYHHFLLEPHSFPKYYVELTDDVEEFLLAAAHAEGSKAKAFSQRLSSFARWKADQEAEGLSVVTKEQAKCLADMRDAIFANPDVSEWFDFSKAKLEVSMFAPWQLITNHSVSAWKFQLKGRADIDPGGDALIDLKTARTAHPDEFAKAAWRLGYHIQAAFYIDLARKNGLDKRRFGFLAQDKFPPYLACIHWMGEDWIRYGRIRYTKILLDLADCIQRNDWPGYRSGELMPPSWAQTEIESVAA